MKRWLDNICMKLRNQNRYTCIEVDGLRYLYRHYLLFLEDTQEYGKIVRRPEVKFNVFLHNFLLPDPDRHLHNHPWWYATFVLWGGYYEEVFTDETRKTTKLIWRGRFSFRINNGNYHQVKHLSEKGCYTLFFRGPKVRRWGFWVNGQHIDHEDYLAREHQYIQENLS